jgi:hypothetical protein
MFHKLGFAPLLFFSVSWLFAQNPDALKYAEIITKKGLYDHLSVLASDEYEGRETGKPGQRKAAAYIAQHFKDIGLSGPTQESNPYFQTFNLYKQQFTELELTLGKNKLKIQKDLLPLGKFDFDGQAEFVFAGYGLEHEKRNDYAGLNVEGKIVVVLEGEPKNSEGTYLLSGSNFSSSQSRPQSKSKLAREKKAAGLIIIMDDQSFDRSARYAKAMLSGSQLSFDNKSSTFASILLKQGSAAPLLGCKPKKVSTTLLNALNKKSLPNFPKGYIKTQRLQDPVETENVLGYLEGTSKKEEILVITAHHDHIGIIDGQINNGADDDGSGTTALLEIANAFAQAAKNGIRPFRSILFLSVTGEEKGLFGSSFYTENPIFSLQQTIANLNVDMIGRVDDRHLTDSNYVYIIGSDLLSTELHALSEKTRQDYNSPIKFDYRYRDRNDPEQFYYRSDHYNFAKNNIPVIFYFTGVHPDYHRPTDDIEKIMFGKMSSITKLIFYTAWELANVENRPKVDVKEE